MSAGPLAGVRVVVTRASHQAAALVELFAAEGAQVEQLPLLEIVPPDDRRPLDRAASELALYEWVVFTSANAVEALLDAAGGSLPQRLSIAAVGAATSRKLGEHGLRADLVPSSKSRAEGLVELLGPRVRRRRRVLLPQAEDARRELAEGLERAGAEVVRVCAYRKRVPVRAAEEAARLFPAAQAWGWVTFTSPSTVVNLIDLLGPRWRAGRASLLAASIGPVTDAALRGRGIEPAATAASPSDRGLVEAVVAAVKRRGGVARPDRTA